MNTVQFDDGYTVSVGQEVEVRHKGTHCMATVSAIRETGRGVVVMVEPDETRCIVTSGRWPLAKQGNHPHPDYWDVRDHGVPGGSIKRSHWNWVAIQGKAA